MSPYVDGRGSEILALQICKIDDFWGMRWGHMHEVILCSFRSKFLSASVHIDVMGCWTPNIYLLKPPTGGNFTISMGSGNPLVIPHHRSDIWITQY